MDHGFLGSPLTFVPGPVSVFVCVGGVPFVVWRTEPGAPGGPQVVPAVTTWNISSDLRCLGAVSAGVTTTAGAAAAAAAAVIAQETAAGNETAGACVTAGSAVVSVQNPNCADLTRIMKEKSIEKRRQLEQWESTLRLDVHNQGAQQHPTRAGIPLPTPHPLATLPSFPSSSSPCSSLSGPPPFAGIGVVVGGQVAGSKDVTVAEKSEELVNFSDGCRGDLGQSSFVLQKSSPSGPSSGSSSTGRFVPSTWRSRLPAERTLTLDNDDIEFPCIAIEILILLYGKGKGCLYWSKEDYKIRAIQSLRRRVVFIAQQLHVTSNALQVCLYSSLPLLFT